MGIQYVADKTELNLAQLFDVYVLALWGDFTPMYEVAVHPSHVQLFQFFSS
jgi:hypothetical protein